MHAFTLPTTLLLALSPLVSAWGAPQYSGMSILWQDGFGGPGGGGIDENNWNIITGLRVNNELQDYTTSRRNMQLSGGETLQIVPWREGDRWTSARVESKMTFTPAPGRRTWVESTLRFGDNPIGNKAGMWPAFWMLGDNIRHGMGWPWCGEIDIMETVNGQLTGHGTVHCDRYPGGICNEPQGIASTVGIPDQSWHNWRVQFDRTSGDWQAQSITWFLDGNVFHTLQGSRVGAEVWGTLCHMPLFVILNVAVGGNWPGYPNGATMDGYGSMMEVGYVALYQSN